MVNVPVNTEPCLEDGQDSAPCVDCFQTEQELLEKRHDLGAVGSSSPAPGSIPVELFPCSQTPRSWQGALGTLQEFWPGLGSGRTCLMHFCPQCPSATPGLPGRVEMVPDSGDRCLGWASTQQIFCVESKRGGGGALNTLGPGSPQNLWDCRSGMIIFIVIVIAVVVVILASLLILSYSWYRQTMGKLRPQSPTPDP